MAFRIIQDLVAEVIVEAGALYKASEAVSTKSLPNPPLLALRRGSLQRLLPIHLGLDRARVHRLCTLAGLRGSHR